MQKALAQAFQLAQGDVRAVGQLLRRQRGFHVLFHQIQYPNQSRVLNTELPRQILPLTLRRRADPAADLPITDAGAETGAGILFNKMQHQIGGGVATGAADQMAVHLIE